MFVISVQWEFTALFQFNTTIYTMVPTSQLSIKDTQRKRERVYQRPFFHSDGKVSHDFSGSEVSKNVSKENLAIGIV